MSNIYDDSSYMIPMDTETVHDQTSTTSKFWRFLSQAFLFLVVCGLIALLVIQIIIMSAGTEVKA